MMTITKEKLKQQIEQFPDTISMDEVIERLIMLEKIETRKQESDNNETIEEDELKEEMKNGSSKMYDIFEEHYIISLSKKFIFY